jgi:hypothetical protein
MNFAARWVESVHCITQFSHRRQARRSRAKERVMTKIRYLFIIEPSCLMPIRELYGSMWKELLLGNVNDEGVPM